MSAYSPPGGYQVPPQHPRATLALVLGILSLLVCGVLGPFAWSIGSTAVKEIDAAPGTWSGRETANAGRIIGIVATVLLVLSVVLFVVVVLGLGLMSSGGGISTGTRTF
jgi:hypothetical protein